MIVKDSQEVIVKINRWMIIRGEHLKDFILEMVE
jgi:hypothetical protein